MRVNLILIIVLILSLYGCSPKNIPTKIDNNPDELTTASKLIIYPGPQPECLGTQEIDEGIKIYITEEKDEWIHVKFSGGEGWLPKWYILSDQSKQVKDIQSEEKVLNQDTSGSLYPNGPKIVDLEKGKLLTPIREWGGWHEVKIIVYDIPSVQLAWIPKNLLSSADETNPIEGYLAKGTEVYEIYEFEKISPTNLKNIENEMVVFIISKRDNYVLVGANGGWTAWTEKDNLSYKK